MISDGLNILTDPKEVADTMNTFYSSVADQMGYDQQLPKVTQFQSTCDFVAAAKNYHQSHTSVLAIRTKCNKSESFAFKHVDQEIA